MGKIGSTILTFLLSIPVAAVGLMAVFGVPQIPQLNASPSQQDLVVRDPYHQDPWANASPTTVQGRSNAQMMPGSRSSDEAPSWSSSSPYSAQTTEQTAPAHHLPVSNPFGQPTSSEQGLAFTADATSHASESMTPPQQPAHQLPVPQHNNGTSHAFARTAQAPHPASSQPASGVGSNPFATTSMSTTPPRSARPHTIETSAQMLDWHQASARLSELGIEKYHLERGHQDGSFLFVCLFVPEENAQVTHRFEAEGSDPLIAVNQVLGQIDGWLQQQYRDSHLTRVRF